MRGGFAAVDVDGLQHGFGLQFVVADELAVAALDVLQDGDLLAFLLQAEPRALLLVLQFALESVEIDADALFHGQVAGEIQGKAVGVGKAEQVGSGQQLLLFFKRRLQQVVEDLQAVGQGAVEALLLHGDDFGDEFAVGLELRVERLHHLDDLGR